MFHPVNECIYCGAKGDDAPLGREHTFPLSLGGTIILPHASCQKCASITRDFEHTCARTIFGNLRLVFDLPSRRRRDRPKLLPIEVEVDGKTEVVEVPISDYPAPPVIFPVFGPPGILLGLEPRSGFPGGQDLPVLPNVADNDDRLRRLRETIGRPASLKVRASTPITPFARMIVKIAYSSAVAEFGLGSFVPAVKELILGRSEHLSHYLGCMATLPVMLESRFSDGTHRAFYGLISGQATAVSPEGIRISRSPEYFAAAVRLFKDMGSPTYWVILGVPDAELREKLRAGDH